MRRARVFLADDHSLLLEAFSTLIETDYEVVGTATDGRQMLAEVRKLEPDVVVLDISMPNLNGFDAAVKLHKLLPDIKIIFLTVNDDPTMVSEALDIGANGYLLKKSSADQLLEALNVVLNGGTYVTPQIEQDSGNDKTAAGAAAAGKPALSVRQREVLQLLAEGKSMKQVAGILHITPRTVAFHKYQIMEVLGIKTNSELIQYAIKLGLVT